MQEAADLENKAIKEKPKSWLPHAAMSFFLWEQGNAPDAIVEGQKAIRCAPNNAAALLNLAHMHLLLENYRDAISLYEKVRDIDRDNWTAPIRLAQCFLKENQPEQALEVLGAMRRQESTSFDWCYQLGNAYLVVDKADLAVTPLENAVRLAATPQEKSGANTQLFFALVCNKQTDRARAMMDSIFEVCKPRYAEVYVRAAAELLEPSQPQRAKVLLESAVKNMDETKDSDCFFRLGRIFEQKGHESDATAAGAWLDYAAEAYKQAVELNPIQSAYHLALSGVLTRQGKSQEAATELKESASFDRADLLAPFLMSKVKPAESAGLPVDLSEVKFTLDGLTCACHISKIENALNTIKGVVFVKLSRIKPYEGVILVNLEGASVDEVLAECPRKAFESADLQRQLSFVVTSREPVKTLQDAVRVTQAATFGDPLRFHREFDVVPPTLPAPALAESM